VTADRRQHLYVRAVGAQLIRDRVRTCFVFLARRVHGRNADQALREIDDLIGGAIDLRDDPIG